MRNRVLNFGLFLIVILLLSFVESDLSYVANDAYKIKSSKISNVYFSNVSSLRGSEVHLSNDGSVLNLGNVILNRAGDREVITYELTNGISSFDVEGEVYINGSKRYVDDYFIIECSEIGTIGRKDSKEGTISIELKKDASEKVLVPFDFSINFSQVNKRNGLFF